MCKIEKHYFLRKRFRTFYPVVIDIETSGIDSNTNALLEIAVITLKMNSLGLLEQENLLHCHIKPFLGSIIDPNAIAFNKIDPFNPLRGAISEYEALNSILRLINTGIQKQKCSKSIIVAHNAIFDYNFLMAAIKRNKIKNNPFHPFVIFDTATLSGLAVGQTVLARACKEIGLKFDNNQAHSALYDTRKTANLFCKIVNYWKKLGGWPPNNKK
ncbi:ribonuclease T [Buchnera aphidicola (Schlechtendalia chinensis)]|uniref:Ribonuclease T n=1 Tax=Buchnera aphidicola subsp. Schlechtendalia chinensis TaxID=118110 RepID=A0A172WDC8_BUCSC|nr:ribonuclease T [Buchnera aphidicola]ANF16980.1 ribonuclease T [Buchnera aphidicola (Schlechtendalia chinensis)]